MTSFFVLFLYYGMYKVGSDSMVILVKMFDLNGPAGTTVTLYGKQKHSPDRGFLIIRKKDDRPITVADLEYFPPNRWVEVAAENSSSGAYSVWYQPYGGFKNNVESVRWGHWWGTS